MKPVIVTLLLTLGALLPINAEAPYWMRGVQGDSINKDRRALVLYGAGRAEQQLYIVCELANRSARPATILGYRDDAGRFYAARVSIDISPSPTGPWKSHGVLPGSESLDRILVKPGSESDQVYIDVTSLRQFRKGSYYARVKLPSGEGTVFAVRELDGQE